MAAHDFLRLYMYSIVCAPDFQYVQQSAIGKAVHHTVVDL